MQMMQVTPRGGNYGATVIQSMVIACLICGLVLFICGGGRMSRPPEPSAPVESTYPNH